MKWNRIEYIKLIILVILLGLASRHIKGIPLWIGDVLWALMVFYIVRYLLIKSNTSLITVISLSFCYLIEVSQLYQAGWINNIRHTVMGGLILGLSFSWGDLLCYSIGIGIGVLTEALK